MKKNNNWMYILGFIFLIFMWANKCDSDLKRKTETNTTSEPKKKISCMVCGKDLTDDYNRISPNGNGNYYCTPCYKQTMRDVHESIQAQGYD